MIKFLGVVLFALVACSSALAAGPSADIAALEAVDEAWLKSFIAGDANAIANLYDDRAVLLPPGSPAANGRAQIRDYFKKAIEGARKTGIPMTPGGKPAGRRPGDMGWQSGTYSVKDKSGKVVETGKYLSISTKKNGKWLYVRDTWNADAPPPAPTPAAAKAPAKK